MLAKEAATDTENQLKTNALKYFTAMFVRPEAKDIQVTVNYTTEGGSKIVVNATAQMPADFTKIIGYDNFNVIASSTSKWGTSRLRVALVLDNTGSMADAGKMAALQTATQGLLTQLQGAVTIPGDVYVSIVPFVKDVNVGASNYNADWIYWGTTTPTAILPVRPKTQPCPITRPGTRCMAHAATLEAGDSTKQMLRKRAAPAVIRAIHTQSNCTGHGTCSVGGSNISQSTCNSSGTCSVAGQTTQSGCTSSGTCSNTNYTSQSACTAREHALSQAKLRRAAAKVRITAP